MMITLGTHIVERYLTGQLPLDDLAGAIDTAISRGIDEDRKRVAAACEAQARRELRDKPDAAKNLIAIATMLRNQPDTYAAVQTDK